MLRFDLAAEASCPCAEVKLPRKPLKPGKEAKIKVTFHARDLDDRGVVTNLITVFYSGPGKYTRLRVRAELVESGSALSDPPNRRGRSIRGEAFPRAARGLQVS